MNEIKYVTSCNRIVVVILNTIINRIKLFGSVLHIVVIIIQFQISDNGNKSSNSVSLTSRSNDLILSSSSRTDPLLEQHDAGNSSSVSGSGLIVGVFGLTVENLRFSVLLLIFLLFVVRRAGGGEVVASMANAARARVLTPT